MRLVAVSMAAFALACAALAQTRGELQAKFGRFDGEGYAVTPELRLTVTFGNDQSACVLELRSVHSSREAHYLGSDIADRVLNEIAPRALREGIPLKALSQMGCAASAVEEYHNVAIARGTNECLPVGKGNVESLSIRWKRAACGPWRTREATLLSIRDQRSQSVLLVRGQSPTDRLAGIRLVAFSIRIRPL